jgi:hypothetical protein
MGHHHQREAGLASIEGLRHTVIGYGRGCRIGPQSGQGWSVSSQVKCQVLPSGQCVHWGSPFRFANCGAVSGARCDCISIKSVNRAPNGESRDSGENPALLQIQIVLDCSSQICGMKAEWARFALVEDAASRSDQVQPVRPPGIGSLNAIVESVDQRRELDSEFAYARASHVETFILAFGAGKHHVIAYVGLHLPHVGRVCLKDINRVKRNLVLVLLCKLVQGGNLPPKWRSGIASEDKDNRL